MVYNLKVHHNIIHDITNLNKCKLLRVYAVNEKRFRPVGQDFGNKPVQNVAGILVQILHKQGVLFLWNKETLVLGRSPFLTISDRLDKCQQTTYISQNIL